MYIYIYIMWWGRDEKRGEKANLLSFVHRMHWHLYRHQGKLAKRGEEGDKREEEEVSDSGILKKDLL